MCSSSQTKCTILIWFIINEKDKLKYLKSFREMDNNSNPNKSRTFETNKWINKLN